MVNIVAISFADLNAFDDEGHIWDFDEVLDREGQEMEGVIKQEDISVIILKRRGVELWAVVEMSDYEPTQRH